MAGLKLSGIRKAYGGVSVLDGVSLDVGAQEFIAFLGPSGSGKSTLLRIIAGLEYADAGEIILDDRPIGDLSPGQRDVAMVFQHYALYPHMSVRENMAFGLHNGGVPKKEANALVEEAAEVLEISALLDCKPGQLSGGQRQRVAIGRAIVKRPKVFLLDEPLSNLDAVLRMRTRVELAQLRQRVAASIIMVTHDQAEAMTLADRIVVINDRQIQQVGAPMEIYSRPANSFVAQFVGSPPMTLAPAELMETAGEFARLKLNDGSEIETRVLRAGLPEKGLRMGVRPEAVRVVESGATTKAKVELVERLGERTLVYARLSDGQTITAEDEGYSRIAINDEISIEIDGAAVYVFGPDGAGHHAQERAA